MSEWIVLVPLLPAMSALFFIFYPLFTGKACSERLVSWLASLVLIIGFLVTAAVAIQMSAQQVHNHSFQFAQWFSIDSYTIDFGFYIDALTIVMLLVITGVGALIHCFATGYMKGEEGFTRFFTYLNLFIAAMVILVMADNLLLLYLGWEGVGLCSFLLIGFWYKDPANGYAARKAFVVTRIGDTAMAIGLFLLFIEFNTLDIQLLMKSATHSWPVDTPMATLCALLLLGGAVGKSAQLPLQTWLPDAMAGPTPVSALIHAATMVTAGVYLIARHHALFELSSLAMSVVTIVGALTLFIAGCSALVQRDIKRILAYSTMSQIGYMFYALGVGAWSAGIFHLMTHAFFKALLFLAAGLLIVSVHHKQDIFEMGGLRKKMPVAFWSFIIGCACLAAMPMSSGYFSKEAILIHAYENNGPNVWWWFAVAGAFLTSLYSFRLIFVVFFGEPNRDQQTQENSMMSMRWPLLVLMLLAIFGALLQPLLVGVFEQPVAVIAQHTIDTAPSPGHGWLTLLLSVPAIAGLVFAFLIWGKGKRPAVPPYFQGIHRWWFDGWRFDQLYHVILIRPLLQLAHINNKDIIDSVYTGVANLSSFTHRQLSVTQTGQLRWYVTATTGGAVVILMIMVLVWR